MFRRPIEALSSKKFQEFRVETTTGTKAQRGLKSLSLQFGHNYKDLENQTLPESRKWDSEDILSI